MKSGTCCVLMTAQAAKDNDHEIKLPSAHGCQVYYLYIYQTNKQKVINHRFIVADNIEPELDSLLKEIPAR